MFQLCREQRITSPQIQTYLSRVLVHVNVNDPSVFVALLDDIILDLHGPAGIIFSEKEMGGSMKCDQCWDVINTSICLTLVG